MESNMLGKRTIAGMLDKADTSDPRYADPREVAVGDMIGRVDPSRINKELFEETGGWHDNSMQELSGLDDDDYNEKENIAALSLTQHYEKQFKTKLKDLVDDPERETKGRELKQGYTNKLSKYKSIFDRMQGELLGKAMNSANSMYAPGQGE